MMKWSIPAKTFLLGEYAAVAGGSAIILTTTPCFELHLTEQPSLNDIHPDSPAGQWWQSFGDRAVGLHWVDPYLGRGGMGASSAQFIGAYVAGHYLMQKDVCHDALLDDYLHYSWQGKGLRPSGYDVIAQLNSGCAYINRQQCACQEYAWPFSDLAFVLLRTGQKLATHHYLQNASLPNDIDSLSLLVSLAKEAFEQSDSQRLIQAVNGYHQQLMKMRLVADHSLVQMTQLQQHPHVLAIKGCGAMGADVLLLLVSAEHRASIIEDVSTQGWEIIGTNDDLFSSKCFDAGNSAKKTLQFSSDPV